MIADRPGSPHSFCYSTKLSFAVIFLSSLNRRDDAEESRNFGTQVTHRGSDGINPAAADLPFQARLPGTHRRQVLPALDDVLFAAAAATTATAATTTSTATVFIAGFVVSNRWSSFGWDRQHAFHAHWSSLWADEHEAGRIHSLTATTTTATTTTTTAAAADCGTIERYNSELKIFTSDSIVIWMGDLGMLVFFALLSSR